MRSFMLGLLGFLVFFTGQASRPDRTQVPQGVFWGGERLEYKVKWLFFRIGTIVITTEHLPASSEKFRTTITLDSNPDLFFISIHNRYEAIVHRNPVRCESFRSFEIDDEDTLITSYTFLPSRRQVHMVQRHVPPDTLVREEVMDSVDRFFDGASLFFFARSIIHSDTSLTVPTLVEFDMFSTDMTVNPGEVAVSISALDLPVKARELSGHAHFEGSTFGGFSGEFKGWFTDDHAAVPLRAEMSITLGTVDVELERWTRMGWSPPTVSKRP